MNFVKKSLLGAIAAVAVTTAAQASLFQINPVISAQFNGSTGALEAGSLGGAGLNPAQPKLLPNATVGKIYSVDFYVKYTPSTGEPSFGNMTFDLVPTNGVSRLPVSPVVAGRSRNYLPVTTQFDADGDGTNDTSYLAFNSDAGADWLSVLTGVDTTVDTTTFANPDPRPTIGQSANPVFGANPNGFLYGRAYVLVNDSGTLQENIYQPGTGSPPSTWNSPSSGGNNTLSNPQDAAGLSGVATFAVPEPASMLAGAAMMGFGMLRRRRA